jgi:O-antigen ligase
MNSKHPAQFGTVCTLASLITLVVAPIFTDPVLLPKFILLVGTSFTLWFYSGFKGLKKIDLVFEVNTYKTLWKDPIFLSLVCFLLTLLFSALTSESPMTAFFGLAGRRNGWVTYLSLFLLFLLARKFSSLENLKKFLHFLAFSASVQATYMLIQRFGFDPLPWDLVYENSMVGTLGNPNFSSAFVAMGLPAITYCSIARDCQPQVRFFFKAMFFVGITAIALSGVYQGPLALILSFIATCFVFVRFRIYDQKIKLAVYCFTALGSILIVMGLLKAGPLAVIFSKQTFQIRSEGYWPVAINMARENPIFGVGLEQFGNYFPQFFDRDLRALFGPILTDNAHNYYLHFLAEGGFPVFFSYLSLCFFLTKRMLKLLKSSSWLLGFFALATYFSFLGQSLVSIDHIGISMWIWMLAGLFSGLEVHDSVSLIDPKKKFNKSSKSEGGNQIIIPTYTRLLSFVIFTIILTPLLLLGALDNKIWTLENSLRQGSSVNVPASELTRIAIYADLWHFDPILLSRTSSILLSYAQLDKGFEILNRASSLSPDSPAILNLRASATETIVGRASGEKFRAAQVKLEPFNPQVSLEYIRNLIAANKLPAAERELIRLESLGDENVLQSAISLVKSARG